LAGGRFDNSEERSSAARSKTGCAAAGADAVLLMCTGHFEPVPARVPVYDAESLAQASVVEQTRPLAPPARPARCITPAIFAETG
jgi:hypothetical protein